MTAPNPDLLPQDDQNQNPQPSNIQQGSGSLDPTILSFMQEVRARNDNIEQQLGALTRALSERPAVPNPTPTQNFDPEDMVTRPAEVIGAIVDSKVSKLRDDISSQLRPLNEFVVSSAKRQAIDKLKSQLKGIIAYQHLNNPAVESAFDAMLMSSNEINNATVQLAYVSAIGAATLQNPGSFSSPNPNPNPSPNPNPGNPPYVPPNPNPNNRPAGNLPALPPLDENEEKLRKEYGYSHARMAFGVGKIDKATYLKYEPNAKIPEGF